MSIRVYKVPDYSFPRRISRGSLNPPTETVILADSLQGLAVGMGDQVAKEAQSLKLFPQTHIRNNNLVRGQAGANFFLRCRLDSGYVILNGMYDSGNDFNLNNAANEEMVCRLEDIRNSSISVDDLKALVTKISFHMLDDLQTLPWDNPEIEPVAERRRLHICQALEARGIRVEDCFSHLPPSKTLVYRFLRKDLLGNPLLLNQVTHSGKGPFYAHTGGAYQVPIFSCPT